MAQQALDSHLKNYAVPFNDVLSKAAFDLNKTRLERDLVAADRDVAKAELDLVKAKKAPDSERVQAER
jgi:hypothetical protein